LYINENSRESQMTEDHLQQPLLKRVLLKTKPVPYPIWMAGLGVIALSAASAPAFIIYRPAATVALAIIFLFGLCLGALMGFFVVRKLGLPWFATFGEVLERGSKPIPEKHEPKSRGRFFAILAVLAVVMPLLGYCVGAMRTKFGL
jgi:hypothetical protein